MGTDDLAGALEYFDCLTDDARLVLENVLDAMSLGAMAMSHTEMTGLERTEGRISGVLARDVMTGDTLTLETSSVAIAGGPWTDALLATAGIEHEHKLLAPTKGTHIVVDHERLPIKRAICMFTTDDRVLFALPWVERTVLGTTDTYDSAAPEKLAAEARDVDYICEHANQFFPDAHLTPNDVIATWGGPASPHRAARGRPRLGRLARARGVRQGRGRRDHRRRQAHDVPPHGQARGGRGRRCPGQSPRHSPGRPRHRALPHQAPVAPRGGRSRARQKRA